MVNGAGSARVLPNVSGQTQLQGSLLLETLLFFAQRWSIKKHSPDSCSLLQSSVQVRVTQDGPGAPESVVIGTGS